ncbi:MAG: DNA repair protein RecN [Candidatus Nanopelagicales bacterium]
MITFLKIKNLGLIKDVELDLKQELIAITGETGAGKTMVLSAIDALLGKKIATNLLALTENTSVEAEFEIVDEEFLNRLKEEEFLIEDNRLIVSRIFSKDGKSKSFLGGRAVPATLLGEYLSELIFVHGQKDQAKLTKSGFALNAIDQYADHNHRDILKAHQEMFLELKQMRLALTQFDAEIAVKEQERLRLEQMIQDIQEVNPADNEDAELTNKINNLQNTEKIKIALSIVGELAESTNLDTIEKASKLVASLAPGDTRFQEIQTKLNMVIEELVSTSSRANALSLEMSGQEMSLDELEDRRFKINRLCKLYGPSLEQVINNLNQAELTLVQLADPGSYRAQLIEKITAQEIRVSDFAQKLSKNREKVAKQLGDLVTKELKDLMLSEAEFVVAVETVELHSSDHGQNGIDKVEFIFRSNKNLSFGNLAKIASGGELSRLMLALEVVMAQVGHQATMIFDEVDAGVGGKAAIEIGKRLKRLAKASQVVLVTHLPQIAAFSQTHLVVEKSQDLDDISTSVKIVQGEAQLMEISRMLAGLAGSESALQHAGELLKLAQSA